MFTFWNPAFLMEDLLADCYNVLSHLWVLTVYRVSKKVTPLDKESSNSLLFYCFLKISDSKYWFLDLTPQPLKSLKISCRYASLKIKSRFRERQNLEVFGWSIPQKDRYLLWILSALDDSLLILCYFQVEEGYGDHLASIFNALVSG